MVIMNCPNCGASLQVDDKRQYVFCQYCGTRITDIKSTVIVDRSVEIKNLLLRMKEYESKGEYAQAKEYCKRILDIDPNNSTARMIENRLSYYVQNNVIIKFDSNGKAYLRVKIDERDWVSIQPKGQAAFNLQAGMHRIMFSSRKTYDKSVKVNESNQQMIITFREGKIKNEIFVSYR